MADNAGTATAAQPQVTPKADAASTAPATSQPAATVAAGGTGGNAGGAAGTGPTPAAEPAKPTLLGDVKGPEGKPAEKPAEKPDYSKLKLSEGSMLKPADLDAAKAFAEKHGMSADGAQAYLTERETAVKSYHESLLASHTQNVEANKQTLMAHKTYGGENIKATNDAMTGVMRRFGSDKLMDQVIRGGFNWNPDFAEFLMKVHEATKDDKLVAGNQPTMPSGEGSSFVDVMYPGLKPK